MNLLLILPLLIPMIAAILSMLARSSRRAQRTFAVAGTALLFASGLLLVQSVWQNGIQAAQMSAWPAPFGITLVADLFSAIMVAIAGFMGLAVAVYSLATIDRQREAFGYHPLLHILLMGVCGAFLTGDLFNLYVWFEVMLMASFVLMALGGERAQMEGAIKYVTINLISSAVFLAAVGILYGVMGTLNMADLALKLRDTPRMDLLTTVAMLFLVAFGIKAAVFPLFFWLPASYHTPPVAVSAIFAGLLTKVGVYALIRVFTLLFVQDVAYTHTIILALAGLTMVTGVLGAMAQNEFRRILSFHIVSQIGYMILGLGFFTTAAVAGSIFYIIHHIIVKTNLFLLSGAVHRLQGTYELKKLGGLYSTRPGLSILFLIPALSLAGLPPLSGFFAKFTLVQAGLETQHYLLVATALGVGLLTLFSMTKIWAEAFWKGPPEPGETGEPTMISESRASRFLVILPIASLALATLLIGLAAEPLYLLASRAAEQLMNPVEYIDAVLGGGS
ncbi:MAG TPA: Na+/H+ antiporter subunit D [Candidatus Binatia bacterium]|nr:Na+/H+ antiporter subunit D [Candidatus Binatia bacterium]